MLSSITGAQLLGGVSQETGKTRVISHFEGREVQSAETSAATPRSGKRVQLQTERLTWGTFTLARLGSGRLSKVAFTLARLA